MGVVSINLVEFGWLLFWVIKNFKKNWEEENDEEIVEGLFEPKLEDKESEENKKPKYNLPRTAEVLPCEWPCDEFLRAAGIYDDFYYLAENVGLVDFLRDQREQYLLLTNIFVQFF